MFLGNTYNLQPGGHFRACDLGQEGVTGYFHVCVCDGGRGEFMNCT